MRHARLRASTVTWPTGYGRRVLAQVDSTMDEAARISDELSGPEWVLALDQTASRGRRGRDWVFPSGNFAATLILPLDEGPAEAALRSFVMSAALLRALGDLTGRTDLFALKWPNDVLLSGGKLAGILLESRPSAGPLQLFIGVGVNLVSAPPAGAVEPGAFEPVSLEAETGLRITPEAMLDRLATRFAELEAQFATYGFAPIRTLWLDHAARRGERLRARTGQRETEGTFIDIDAHGHLVLQTARGLETIAAAEVFF